MNLRLAADAFAAPAVIPRAARGRRRVLHRQLGARAPLDERAVVNGDVFRAEQGQRKRIAARRDTAAAVGNHAMRTEQAGSLEYRAKLVGTSVGVGCRIHERAGGHIDTARYVPRPRDAVLPCPSAHRRSAHSPAERRDRPARRAPAASPQSKPHWAGMPVGVPAAGGCGDSRSCSVWHQCPRACDRPPAPRRRRPLLSQPTSSTRHSKSPARRNPNARSIHHTLAAQVFAPASYNTTRLSSLTP